MRGWERHLETVFRRGTLLEQPKLSPDLVGLNYFFELNAPLVLGYSNQILEN